MDDKIKTGKDVIDEFFSEILNIEGIDIATTEKLIELYSEGRFTDSNITNTLDELRKNALAKK